MWIKPKTNCQRPKTILFGEGKSQKTGKTLFFFSGGGGVFLPNQTIEWLIAQSGLYSFISLKSVSTDKKRTLVEKIQEQKIKIG
jgi:hypothetical protein